MKQKIIIPRKDHEIYFIPAPDKIKFYMMKKHVLDALSELHPNFSIDSHVDIKSVYFNKKRVFMATVIASDVLKEYRIMYKDALFYTNTSILANEKRFSTYCTSALDDELIGFDSEKNIPVSIPLDTVNTSGDQVLSGRLKNIPLKCSVFSRNIEKWTAASILTGLIILTLFLIINFKSNTDNQNYIDITSEDHSNYRFAEQPSQIINMPSVISMLAHLSQLYLQANGEIENWQFNGETDPVIIIKSKNITALKAKELFNELEYIALQDIQNVNYTDGKPQMTIELHQKKNVYSQPVSFAFGDKNTMYAEIAELTDSLAGIKIDILSEILPSAHNNFQFYTLSFKTNDINLIGSMEIIEEFCEKFSLQIKRLDVFLQSDRKIFIVTCSISPTDIQKIRIVKLDAEKESIPLAFGYKPVEVKQIKINEEKQIIASIHQEIPDIGKIIGSITDAGGKNVYFQNSNGKFTIRNE